MSEPANVVAAPPALTTLNPVRLLMGAQLCPLTDSLDPTGYVREKLPGLMISPSSKVKVSRSFFAAGESARITEVCRTVRYRASSTAAVANAPIVQAQKTTARPRTPHQHDSVLRRFNSTQERFAGMAAALSRACL
jgi:hypothetical protein